MGEKINAAITGVAAYVPDYILSNDILSEMVDTNDEWITSRTGIKERRILKGEEKGTSHMAIPAVKELLEKTNTDPLDVELIICATVTPDMVFPATANLIADGVGAKNCYGFDVNAACSGFIFALTSASQYIMSGEMKKVIVVGGDKMSAIVDYTDRTTCIIFGDGAGAVMLEPNTEGYGLLDHMHFSDGSGWINLHQKAGGSRRPASHKTVDAREHVIFQEGREVFKFAVKNMADVSYDIMKKNKLEPDDISYLVPHQANKRIIDATANRMGLPIEKVMITIQKYGNTTSATIPLCLRDYEDKLKKGDNLVLSAFGGGFTWGAIYVKWAYDS
jgi:3-oxoacyl-[acyl-carrier-protein] synthase III